MTQFPVVRMRRLRRTPTLRALVRETSLDARDFIYPLFVTAEKNKRKEITSMPGVAQLSVDGVLQKEIESVVQLGIRSVLLFGIPSTKDATATQSYAADAPVQKAIKLIKQTAPDLAVMTDVCLCEYTDHGHCGIIKNGAVDNDSTLGILGKVVVSHAASGADVVAPSGMMDGMVGAIFEWYDLPRRKVMNAAGERRSGFVFAREEAEVIGERLGVLAGRHHDERRSRMLCEGAPHEEGAGATLEPLHAPQPPRERTRAWSIYAFVQMLQRPLGLHARGHHPSNTKRGGPARDHPCKSVLTRH